MTSELRAAADKLAAAIRRAVEAHGAPNRFAAGELHREHGAPRATTVGILMNGYQAVIVDSLRADGLTARYTQGRPSMVVVDSLATPRPIDRIDSRGDIREHLTRDGRTTLCGWALTVTQPSGGNAPCRRCAAIAARTGVRKS